MGELLGERLSPVRTLFMIIHKRMRGDGRGVHAGILGDYPECTGRDLLCTGTGPV